MIRTLPPTDFGRGPVAFRGDYAGSATVDGMAGCRGAHRDRRPRHPDRSRGRDGRRSRDRPPGPGCAPRRGRRSRHGGTRQRAPPSAAVRVPHPPGHPWRADEPLVADDGGCLRRSTGRPRTRRPGGNRRHCRGTAVRRHHRRRPPPDLARGTFRGGHRRDCVRRRRCGPRPRGAAGFRARGGTG